jgi:polysaccharide deacetylase family protein (PEP-CTERM system associated)
VSVIRNALSFDIEDYFQVAALAGVVHKDSWELRPSRVEQNTLRLLEMLSRRGQNATFFVLGWIAERHPRIVREIVAAGHEVACHGYSHELVYRQTRETFRAETRKARSILEEQAQTPIRGYRAASWSIVEETMWALEILHDEGFVYDSSIFPTHHDIYGMPGALRYPHRISLRQGGSLLEFPPSTVRFGRINLPVSGGGYFRLLPLAVTRWAIRHVNREGLPFLFYLHPWEIDPDQPRIAAGVTSSFRHYSNLAGCERKLDALLAEFAMGTLWDTLRIPVLTELRVAAA